MKTVQRHNILKKLAESKIIWYGVSTLILLGLISLADVGKFFTALRSINLSIMLLALTFGLSVFLIWGYVWHSFFRELEFNSDIKNSYKIVMAGNFMNSITPLGQLGGEPFMAYIVSEHTEAEYEEGLSAVISADLVNALPFLTYATIGISYVILFTTIAGAMKTGIYAVVIINAVVALLAYLLWFETEKIERIIHKILDYIAERSNYLEALSKTLKERARSAKEVFMKAGKNKRHLAKVCLIAHLGPIAQFISLSLILMGLGIDPTFIGVYLTVILAGLAIFSPTPGGTGTFEAAFSGLLLFFYPGITLDTAVAAAVLFRLTIYWPGILIGYAALINLRRSE